MNTSSTQLTFEIELHPGERLTLPESLVDNVGPGKWVISIHPVPPASAIRDHSAFLNSYGPEDEGLYDDCATG